jgi:hypothetical protein
MAATTAKRGGPVIAPLRGSSPRGMLSQSTITEDGTREPKLCLTNDQSFNSQKGEKRSLDNRVESNSLMPARFGRALMRIMLHYICWLSNRFPKERLLMTKVGCKSTYCRVVCLQPTTALRLCTCTAGILLDALWMEFGGAPNPLLWSDVSEVVGDLANDLARRKDWDTLEWHALHQKQLASEKAGDNDAGFVSDHDEFAGAFEMTVSFSDDTAGGP